MKLTVSKSYYNEEAGIYTHTLKSQKIETVTDLGGIEVKTAKVNTYRFVTETDLDEGQELDFSKVKHEIVDKEFVNKEDNTTFTVSYITISQAA